MVAIFALLFVTSIGFGQSKDSTLKVVFIRHGEKPKKGNNLTCEGFNRSIQLVKVLNDKFGTPTKVYVPALGLGEVTKHCRMFETLIPLAVKYNLSFDTEFEEKDAAIIAKSIKQQHGVVLVSWEHKAIANIVNALGVDQNLTWPDDDFDSIWIVTFEYGKSLFTKDVEGIKPSSVCPF